MSAAFYPQDIPVANSYSRDDFGTPEEVRGWNLCREHVIRMLSGDPDRTPTGLDETAARNEVARIIESYSLTMVPPDAEEYIQACADDAIELLLGWPVRYITGARR